MQEELHALEALTEQRASLQLLVSELLLENQNLRLMIEKLKQVGSASVLNSLGEARMQSDELPSAAKAAPMLGDRCTG